MHVLLYTRRGCHLCDDTHAVLTEYQRRYGFVLEPIDVDAVPALAERYGEWVPVISVGGIDRFRGRVEPPLLDRLLRAEASRLGG
jgi:glutaredoxin